MTNQPKPIEELSAEELADQTYLRDSVTKEYVKDCDCAECQEIMARLRAYDAVMKDSEITPLALFAIKKAREK